MDFRAGSARLSLEPPLGLPMVGFIRQRSPAIGYGDWALETSALAFEADGTRAVLCGVDIVGIGEPEITQLIDRVAEATGADPEGVLLNWNHTHLAPYGGPWGNEVLGDTDPERDARVRAFADVLQDKVVSVCRLAMDRLEPAGIVWGIGEADLAVNRRERSDGTTILGWNPDNLVDNHVTVLQARRPDESAIGTAVAFGCHPVTTGFDMFVYSADFPGPMRDLIRTMTGGECVFLQSAGGNVLPRVAFTDDEREAERMGRRIAVEALHAVADRLARPVRMVRKEERSVMPISAYRRAEIGMAPTALSATRRRVQFPLLPHPSLDYVVAEREKWEAELAAARDAGEVGRVKVAIYHVQWARKSEPALRDGTAPTHTDGWIHALRVGDGVIATGPGETFSEIGMAVKERGPGRPTLYCGYTNGLASYFPTAAEYRYGGYEADYGCRSVGLPSHVAPECEQILVENAVRAAEELFPDAEPWDSSRGWVATGSVPPLEPAPPLAHPSQVTDERLVSTSTDRR
jgi:neutral ceramidase